MKKILPILLVVVVSSCSTIKTSYDYDKTVDFTKFKTYDFSEQALKLPVQELNRNRVIQAIEKEMTARGFTKSNSPDLWVDLQVKAEQKQEATATSSGPGMYGYGRGYRYGGGFSTTQINVDTYIEGTLFINMVANDKLVWQGRGTKTVDEDATPEVREKNINEGVRLIFQKFPVKPTGK